MDEIDGQMMLFEVAEMDRKAAEQKHADFVEKFKPKLTTDDCYTPPLVFGTIQTWVAEHYGLNAETFVRPFFPGGDYERFDYPEGCAVVDNPPFSILAQIVTFYTGKGIPFFLFSPSLTCFNYVRTNRDTLCVIPCGVSVTYENGAKVNTSFVTNMEPGYAVRTFPDLYKAIEEADEKQQKEGKRVLPKYTYPNEVLTAAAAYRLCKYGQAIAIRRDECTFIQRMDAMKAAKKEIFGGGLLLAERAAAERAAAERAAAERAAAERAAATRWPLSERERAIVSAMQNRGFEHSDTGVLDIQNRGYDHAIIQS